MKRILFINGPNINLLGQREPEFYGTESWESIENKLKINASELKVNLSFFQSNHEGNLIDFIHQNIGNADGLVLNPAGLSKTGYSLLDALKIINIPFVEVHLSNIYNRGGWHSESIFSADAIGCIVGFKGYGYELALLSIIKYI